MSVGPNVAELARSMAIEPNPKPVKHKEHIATNRALVGRAGGLLVGNPGAERFPSLGRGHPAAFARATIAA
eukprot:6324837-Alexandrium_andersonii.AAC.1